MSDLNGRTIVVTGATGGLGRAVARLCAAQGGRVLLGYRQQPETAQQLADEIGGGARAVYLDVRDAESIEQACAEWLPEITGFVNNAAVHRAGLLPTLTPQQITEQIETNLLGPIHCCRTVLPSMMAQRKGSIVNIGSISHLRVHPGQAVYAASKGGLAALTRSLALEYARFNIRVNCVEAGPIETSMLASHLVERVRPLIPMKRLAQPEEIAELVVFLLSEKASYITGSNLPVDGGYGL